jgi:3-methyladenine DNA glycosylase AlkC
MTAPAPRRKGASRSADITPELLQALSLGEVETATLTEGLAVDQAVLLLAVFPEDRSRLEDTARSLGQLGILKRMECIAALLWQNLGTAGWQRCLAHRSDTVRGWACFMVGEQAGLTLGQRLDRVRPLADDAHFGVREWAWMGVRPHLARDLPLAVAELAHWTGASSERLRRFACEALRPRGVWCSHIAALKQQPAIALPLLTPLRADPSPYVQDSVANWLNDAAKSQPDWVRALCAQWLAESPLPATRRICERGQRSLPR